MQQKEKELSVPSKEEDLMNDAVSAGCILLYYRLCENRVSPPNDILEVEILGVEILGVDILGVGILRRTLRICATTTSFTQHL